MSDTIDPDACGLASATLLLGLLTALHAKGILTDAEMKALVEGSQKALLKEATSDAFSRAIAIISAIGQGRLR